MPKLYLSFLSSILLVFIFRTTVSAQVVINEFSPASSPEWVELYNNSSETVSLSGYIIHFDDNLEIQKYSFCNDDQLVANSFKLVTLSSNMLNNNGDTISLINNGSVKDSIVYGSGETLPIINNDQSGKREPNGSLNWIVSDNPSQNGDIASFECVDDDTSTPTPSQAKVQVNKAKDQDGNEFDDKDRVKIYIDETYINHYAPETLTFCDGCYCNNASCGFGNHNIRIEKSGYEDWSEQFTVNAGNSLEANPVLRLISTSGPSASQVSGTSTPAPTGSQFKVSIPLSNKPKPEGEKSESGEYELGVLGVQQVSDEEKPKDSPEPEEEGNKLSISVILFILAGVVFIGLAVFLFIKQRKQEFKKTK